MNKKSKYREWKAGDPDAPEQFREIGKVFPDLIVRVYDQTEEELEQEERAFWENVRDLGNSQTNENEA